DTLKHNLLASATRDALRRAGEIAGSAGREVGSIVSARAVVFQINEPYSNEVSAYGMYNTRTREKQITVTVHSTFVLDWGSRSRLRLSDSAACPTRWIHGQLRPPLCQQPRLVEEVRRSGPAALTV